MGKGMNRQTHRWDIKGCILLLLPLLTNSRWLSWNLLTPQARSLDDRDQRLEGRERKNGWLCSGRSREPCTQSGGPVVEEPSWKASSWGLSVSSVSSFKGSLQLVATDCPAGCLD